MESKYIDKYEELKKEYFDTSLNWTYSWSIKSDFYCLDWNFEEQKYKFYKNNKYINEYKDIYEALDHIEIENKSLRNLLLLTDFDFDMIN